MVLPTPPRIGSLLAIAALLGAGLACSSANDAAGPEDTTDSDDPFPTDTDSDSDSDIPPPEGYWFLFGTWTLTAGAVDPASTVELHHIDQTPGCVASGAPTATATPPGDLLAMWAVDAAINGDGGCPWRGPTRFVVGVGASDQALAPAADRAGLSWSTSQGLYVNGPEGAVLVGVIGTSEQLDGSAPALAAGPLPDGVYHLHTLYGIPLPWFP